MTTPTNEQELRELDGCVLHVEHGWITIRTETGWLLWSDRKGSLDTIEGAELVPILSKAIKLYTKWKKDNSIQTQKGE
jgi:hypothetical protein